MRSVLPILIIQPVTSRATVIISVYNRIDFLKLVLAGFEIQTEKNFEIIISDDGSNDKFVSELRELMKTSCLTIRHNWHEDDGFRKNKILNLSISMSAARYLIFSDGDCIPHSRFVEEHLANAEQGVCLVGRRSDISERLTLTLTPERVKNKVLERPGALFGMFLDYFRMKGFHVMNGIYFGHGPLRRFFNRKERGLLGANFSIFKKDLEAINGFDERYTQPTFGEDSDIELRLRLNGIRFKTVMNAAVQYHCHHKLLPRPDESRLLYEQAVKENRPYTPFGIKKEG
jgi:glycosyltransferase involved in cell wall biosynthesis